VAVSIESVSSFVVVVVDSIVVDCAVTIPTITNTITNNTAEQVINQAMKVSTLVALLVVCSVVLLSSMLMVFSAYFANETDRNDDINLVRQSRAEQAAHWASLNVVAPLADRLQPPMAALELPKKLNEHLVAMTTTSSSAQKAASTTTVAFRPGWPTQPLQDVALNEQERAAFERMAYWRESTLTRPGLWPAVNRRKYLVFQTWRGGFNNERMSLELALVHAIALGRVLVLPPTFDMYLLDESHLGDYFDLDHLNTLHPVMLFEEWLDVIGIERPTRKLVPLEHQRDPIWQKITGNPDVFVWEDTDSKWCWVYPHLPATPEEKSHFGHWCLPDAHVGDLASNHTLQTTTSVFIPVRKLFDHYFSHFWFPNDDRMREAMRAVRNYVHYLPRVFKIAARIVAALPPVYNAVHVRRNDFQYTDIREIAPQKIIENTVALLPINEALYLATDNFTAAFSSTWRTQYARVFQLSDFDTILKQENVPKIWKGLLDQLVLTQARTFVSTRLSTFSAFAVRMRGFMGKENVETYFTTDDLRNRQAEERAFGVEGHRDGSLLPTWRSGWLWATWGRDFKEPFEFNGYGKPLVRGQRSP
jgi:hypothetical protein